MGQFLKIVPQAAHPRLDELTPRIDRHRAAQLIEPGADFFKRATARPALQRAGGEKCNPGLLRTLVNRARWNAHPKRERLAMRSLLAKDRDAIGKNSPAKRPMRRSPGSMRAGEAPRRRRREVTSPVHSRVSSCLVSGNRFEPADSSSFGKKVLPCHALNVFG